MIEYDKTAIAPQYITDYLRKMTVHSDALLHELERYAAENNVPVSQPETARLLSVLCRIKRPKKILEVGTAIGYSSIVMAKAAGKACRILTLEYDADMLRIARENISRADLSDRITAVEADAKDYLPYLDDENSYDMIFMDGPKAHYVYMLDECVRLLKKGGILICDNVLYKGMTADEEHVIRRKITIVNRLREFMDAVMADRTLETAILPLGDGVTVSVKK